MPTEVVFAGGHELRVTDETEDLRRKIEESAVGRPLLRLDIEGDREDTPIYVNWGAVAYIRKAAAGQEPRRPRSGRGTAMGGILEDPL